MLNEFPPNINITSDLLWYLESHHLSRFTTILAVYWVPGLSVCVQSWINKIWSHFTQDLLFSGSWILTSPKQSQCKTKSSEMISKSNLLLLLSLLFSAHASFAGYSDEEHLSSMFKRYEQRPITS